jgi:ATP-dependent protease HslVU (ClpYQ) peptidase subunit
MIIAVKKNGVASIGGDLYASASVLQKMPPNYVRNIEKVFTVGSSYLGTDENEAVMSALTHYFSQKKKTPTFANEQEIFLEFMDLHKALKDDYLLETSSKNDGPFEPLGFNTLIANAYGIFGAFSSHSVIEYSRFYAIGRGADYALGALEALYDSKKSSEELVQAALEVVSQFEIESGSPGKIYNVRLK